MGRLLVLMRREAAAAASGALRAELGRLLRTADNLGMMTQANAGNRHGSMTQANTENRHGSVTWVLDGVAQV